MVIHCAEEIPVPSSEMMSGVVTPTIVVLSSASSPPGTKTSDALPTVSGGAAPGVDETVLFIELMSTTIRIGSIWATPW